MQQLEILAYGPIGGWCGISAQDVVAQLRAAPNSDVAIRIHSEGGDALDGIAIANALRAHQGKVTAYVDGLAASSASMICMGARDVVMAESAMMMLHSPWSIAIGDSGAMREQADALDAIQRAYVRGYVQKTGRSDEEIKSLMERHSWATGTWLTAQDAVREKLADRIGPAVQAQARADARRSAAIAGTPAIAKIFAGPAPATSAPTRRRSESMTKKDWADRLKAAVSDEARAALLAEMSADDTGAQSDQEQNLQNLQDRIVKAEAARKEAEDARVKAEAEVETGKYSALFATGKAERKITGPAHEASVRANYGTSAELQKFLDTTQPARELRPETPSTTPGNELTATDRRFAKTLAMAGVVIDPAKHQAHKATVKPPVVRERE